MTKREPYPSEAAEKVLLRLPDGMRERIAVAAKRSGRSMNAEIVQVLETHYPPMPTLDEIVEAVSDIVEITASGQHEHLRSQLLAILQELKRRALSEGAE